MQPLIVAEETRQGVADFLTTTFPATTPGFESLMAQFVATPGNLAKGPYDYRRIHSIPRARHPHFAGKGCAHRCVQGKIRRYREAVRATDAP